MMKVRFATEHHPCCIDINITIEVDLILIVIDINSMHSYDISNSEYARKLLCVFREKLKAYVSHRPSLKGKPFILVSSSSALHNIDLLRTLNVK
jgi:hypothetical protein